MWRVFRLLNLVCCVLLLSCDKSMDSIDFDGLVSGVCVRGGVAGVAYVMSLT